MSEMFSSSNVPFMHRDFYSVEEERTTTAVHIRGVPKDLKKRFRSACLNNQVTQHDVIIDAMKAFIEKMGE